MMLDVRAIDEFEGQGPAGSYHGLGHIPGTNVVKVKPSCLACSWLTASLTQDQPMERGKTRPKTPRRLLRGGLVAEGRGGVVGPLRRLPGRPRAPPSPRMKARRKKETFRENLCFPW